jgi:hypothetical protein
VKCPVFVAEAFTAKTLVAKMARRPRPRAFSLILIIVPFS